MHIFAGAHLERTLSPLSRRISLYFRCRNLTRPSPARLARWTLLSWRQRRCGSWRASPSKIRPVAEHYASTRAAYLLLMDINIDVVWKIFSRRRGAVACGARRHELMKCSVSRLGRRAHVWTHKCTAQHPLISNGCRNNNVEFDCNTATGLLLYLPCILISLISSDAVY